MRNSDNDCKTIAEQGKHPARLDASRRLNVLAEPDKHDRNLFFVPARVTAAYLNGVELSAAGTSQTRAELFCKSLHLGEYATCEPEGLVLVSDACCGIVTVDIVD